MPVFPYWRLSFPRGSGLSPEALIVFALVCNLADDPRYAREDGRRLIEPRERPIHTWGMLTHKGMGTQLGIGERQVSHHIAALVAAGFIRHTPSGNNRPAVTEITVTPGPDWVTLDIPSALVQSMVAAELIVFAAVARHNGTLGWAYPMGNGSTASWKVAVAEHLGFSVRTAKRYLSALVRKGYLVEKRGSRARLLCPADHPWTAKATRQAGKTQLAPVPVPMVRGPAKVIPIEAARRHPKNLEPKPAPVQAPELPAKPSPPVAPANGNLWDGWKATMAEVYPGVPIVPWTQLQTRTVHALARDIGFEEASRVLAHAIRTWDTRDDWGGAPDIRLIRANAQSLLFEIRWPDRPRVVGVTQETRAERAKKARMNRDEWDPVKAAKSPKVGWGDLDG